MLLINQAFAESYYCFVILRSKAIDCYAFLYNTCIHFGLLQLFEI